MPRGAQVIYPKDLGPILIQLPPDLERDLAALDDLETPPGPWLVIGTGGGRDLLAEHHDVGLEDSSTARAGGG